METYNKNTYSYVREYIEKYNYLLLDQDYVNNCTKMRLVCANGHIYNTTFSNFISGGRCTICKKEERERALYLLTKNEVEKHGYKLLSTIIKTKKNKIKLLCPENHEYVTCYEKFHSGKRCSTCANNVRYSYEYVRNYIESYNHTLIDDNYVNNKKRMKIKCDNGHIYLMSFSDFKNSDYRCSFCKSSKGEDRIAVFFEKHNVEYIRQKKFKNCKDKKVLPFDFFLPNHNVLIEYDGIQHYKEVDFFGGEEHFLITKKHDEIKTKFCKKNNIKLIRINYKQYGDIEDILTKLLDNVYKQEKTSTTKSL